MNYGQAAQRFEAYPTGSGGASARAVETVRDNIPTRLAHITSTLADCEGMLAKVEEAIGVPPFPADAEQKPPLNGIAGLTMDLQARSRRLAEGLLRVVNAVA